MSWAFIRVFSKVTHPQANEDTQVQKKVCTCISYSRGIKTAHDIGEINLWVLPASAERGGDCQSVSSSPGCSAEITVFPRLFLQSRRLPCPRLRNHVTQNCVSVCPSWLERSCERACRPSIHTHAHSTHFSTHPSPEEGNLSPAHDVTSCAHTSPCTLYQP